MSMRWERGTQSCIPTLHCASVRECLSRPQTGQIFTLYNVGERNRKGAESGWCFTVFGNVT
jgi:hypothetical protein